MRVVIKRAGGYPVVTEVENTLETYQEIVGGWIETFPFYMFRQFGVLCVCNEEGKFRDNCELNFIYKGDYIFGDVFFVGVDGEEFAGLTDRQIKTIFCMFGMSV